MTDEEHLKKMLVEDDKLSFFYFHGKGILIDNSPISVLWGVSVDISGNKKFAAMTDGIYHVEYKSGALMRKMELKGESSTGEWKIRSSDIVIKSQEDSTELNRTILKCTFSQLFMEKDYDHIDSLKAYVTNFDFMGLEVSTYGFKKKRDKFSLNLEKKTCQFKYVENYSKIKQFLKSEKISSGILSTVSIYSETQETFETLSKELTDLTLFLSSLTLNTNYAHLTEYYSSDSLVKIEVSNSIISKIHNNVIIDNHHITAGLLKAFEKSYQKFKDIKAVLDLNRYIHLMTELQNQKFIELKMANLILVFENLLSKYLVLQGMEINEVEDLNIQQKLGRVNKELKFIPKNLLGDEFRAGVRNPLFHTGSIPFKSIEEKIEIFNEYYDLLIRIYLKIISVEGCYISRKNYLPELI
ncbi:hypothetical protein [Paenibacillus sp. FSL M7-0420]|uniref:hypothetical protein n=1 Tax=Paenibacillus sp. FSL M7-0420 TaxID=2921609 RepID=UPI0030F66BFA